MMLTPISLVKIVNRAVPIMGLRVGSVKVSGERFQMAVKCSNYTGSRKFQTLVTVCKWRNSLGVIFLSGMCDQIFFISEEFATPE